MGKRRAPPKAKVARDEKGRIVAGSASLNPGGRPKAAREVFEARLMNLPQMLDALERIALGGKSTDFAVVAAAKEWTDRVVGKAVQALHLSGPGGQPIEVKNVDLRKLNTEQLDQLDAILAAAAADPGRGEDGEGEA